MKIFVAGHQGMVGSSIVRKLKNNGYSNILVRTRSELDLLDQKKVHTFLLNEKPDFIFIAAAKVGGIHANNTYRADFIYENLTIAANLIGGAHLANINNLCYLGSSCIYPRESSQPIKEDYLLTGKLEPTNEPYAIGKIAGMKMCENFNKQYGRSYFSLMPTNLYGENDNYHPENSHVVPALIRRSHEAKIKKLDKMTVWGTGKALREFLYVDDLANACVFFMEKNYQDSFLNIGTGQEISIKDLIFKIKEIVGFDGKIEFDITKPDGMPRKRLDISKAQELGWGPLISLEEGIKKSYEDFKEKISKGIIEIK